MEVTLSEMTSLLVRTSVFEICMFFVGIFLLLEIALSTKVFWLFLPHLIRGFVGLKINGLLPKSHEIIKQLSF